MKIVKRKFNLKFSSHCFSASGPDIIAHFVAIISALCT
jgi:hypothetical protein